MRIAIQQSNYIPWKGYFDIIRSVDMFVLYDDVQFTRRDWRNRNRIKTSSGLLWLTIPVKVKEKYKQLIREVEVADSRWAKKHWKTICYNYSGTRYFEEYKRCFEDAYKEAGEMKMLTDINIHFLNLINSLLGIKTLIKRVEEYSSEGRRSDRILSLCRASGATEYLTGPSGMNYLNHEKFTSQGVKILIADYSNYRDYTQPWPPFVHFVSIIDLLFCTGKNAVSYMKKT